MHIGLPLQFGYIWFSVMCILSYRGINVCVDIHEYPHLSYFNQKYFVTSDIWERYNWRNGYIRT